jgi:hypothetical protein
LHFGNVLDDFQCTSLDFPAEFSSKREGLGEGDEFSFKHVKDMMRIGTNIDMQNKDIAICDLEANLVISLNISFICSKETLVLSWFTSQECWEMK